MGLVEQGSARTDGAEGGELDGEAAPRAPTERLDDERAADAAEMAGPAATGLLLDEKTRELFAHTGYEHMDHMGG